MCSSSNDTYMILPILTGRVCIFSSFSIRTGFSFKMLCVKKGVCDIYWCKPLLMRAFLRVINRSFVDGVRMGYWVCLPYLLLKFLCNF